jgi:hypothetical protein
MSLICSRFMQSLVIKYTLDYTNHGYTNRKRGLYEICKSHIRAISTREDI